MLGLLFPEPPRCLLCRQNFIQNPEEAVCAPCLAQVQRSAPPLCRLCGRKSLTRAICYDCRRRSESFFLKACSYGPYRGKLRELILAVKKDRRTELLPILAEYLADVWAAELVDKGVSCLVPVPMAEEKRRERGFNQAELLARKLGGLVRVRVCEALTWQGERRAQIARDREQRLEGMGESLGLSKDAELVAGEVVCLVDDVYTTGSTANACAKKLHEAGARAVYVLTLAR
ncbi:ComF family protein [Tumebacillus sp. ITR2]|uniref:ComF family protein n=1 Tax=Tumebacillus amylolyticus TaxID=2801339 RepID=A0ABS1J5K1_9BACL|nr:ComF family protein [Tumebacillus amylolyticus]MBL0385507.1 ComF family protein [Tumebacillus amylolyticus]